MSLAEKCDLSVFEIFTSDRLTLCYLFLQDARGDQCDSCGKLINAIELKVKQT